MKAGWPMVPLGEVLAQYKEYIQTPEMRIYPKLTVKLYGRGVFLDEPADGALLKMKRHQVARAGQVILSEIWGKKGAIGFVPTEGDGALCTSHFFLFDVHSDHTDPGWLRAIFRANYLQEQLDADAKGTTGYAAVRPKNLLAATIPLPPIEEQRRIVARIEALAAKIAEAHRLRASIMDEDGILVRNTARSALESDRSWPHVVLESVCCEIVDCLHSNPICSPDGTFPTLRSPDVEWGRINVSRAYRTDEHEYARRTRRSKLFPGDVVLVREGGGTGKAGIVEPGQRCSLGQRVMQLRPNRELVEPRFLLYQWLSPLIICDQIESRMKGSASPHLNIKALRKFDFVLPPIEEQQRIVSHLDAVSAKAESLKSLQHQSAAELDALLPSILDRAFKGEL